jgi:hypothetical protein
VASQGDSIRSYPSVFLDDRNQHISDALGDPRETTEPDSRLFVSTVATVTVCLLPDRRQNDLVRSRRAGGSGNRRGQVEGDWQEF